MKIQLGCLTCSNKWYIETDEEVVRVFRQTKKNNEVIKCPNCNGDHILILEKNAKL